MTEDQVLNNLIPYILQKAKDARYSAGMNGQWSDNGASNLENEVDVYLAGWQHTIPSEWKKYEKHVTNTLSTDYETYLTLKAKFEDKS